MRKMIVTLLLVLIAPASIAEPLLYQIEDEDSAVWLLGSVHALRPSDYPLDTRIENAYAEAERVVLELAPDQLDPAIIGPQMLQLARLPQGKRLSDMLSEDEYRQLQETLSTFGLKAEQFEGFEPWFVALQLVNLNLLQQGYASSSGVDQHFAERALQDAKETSGLESVSEQLRLFDNLPLQAQRALLLDASQNGEAFAMEMERIMRAWREGDARALAQLADEELGKNEALREALLVTRNRNWAEEIPNYLEKPGDTLVIVGALHLPGTDGVVELLRERGYRVKKVDE